MIGLCLALLFSCFFSGAEAVLLSIGIDRAKQYIDEGGSRGKIFTFMVERPNELLTTILVGNNIANVFAATLSTTIVGRFFKSDAIGISVGITTLAILLFGEVIPKTFGRNHAEKLSVFIIRSLQFFYIIFYPLVVTMVFIISKVLGKNARNKGRMITQNDVEYMINKAEDEKTMDSKQLDLLTSILEFPKIKIKDIMVPRPEIKYVDSSSTFTDVIKMIREDGHSRYPVCNGEIENFMGTLHVKDLAFIRKSELANFSLESILKEPFFVYEHMRIQAVFDYMNRKKVHQALVKDETGIVVGIVTLEDIVEEIMGEIQDEHDDDEVAIEKEYTRGDLVQGVSVDGTVQLRELDQILEIKIPLNDNYSTLAGFLLDNLGNNFPKEEQIIIWEGLSFELTKVDNYQIKRVRIRDVDGEKHFRTNRHD